ncbi:DUF3072 domain-containing protein [Microbacteriaceae bacterium 4G12]
MPTNDNTTQDSTNQDDASQDSTGQDSAPSSGETLGAKNAEPASSAEKDPSDWVTGDEPMTGAQRSYLDSLARQAGEELSADLTKAEASEQIDRLQDETGHGDSGS